MPIEQYRDGIFRPESKSGLRRGRLPSLSPNPDFNFQRPLDKVARSKSLSVRESDLFRRMTIDGPVKSFAVFMQTVEGVIVKQELGVSLHEINPTHLALVDFYRRTIVDMDRYIDDHREEFMRSMNMGGDEFFSAVQDIRITRAGEPVFSVGEAFDVFRKFIHDEEIYPNPRSRQLLKQELEDFENIAVKDVFRTHEINPSSLSSRETQRLKEIYNGLYAQLIFDIACADLVDQVGYLDARDRYVASKLSFQYRDDVRDVIKDYEDGSANMILAFAKDFGEQEGIVSMANELIALSDNTSILQTPAHFQSFCARIAHVAPQAYRATIGRQQELLSIAELPESLHGLLQLPL